MLTEIDRQFGAVITRLVNKENLDREEARDAFQLVLDNATTEMQQGAFLAALSAKGETADEAAGAWEAIYLRDTNKVELNDKLTLVDNSGTGMDSFKTFNISTAASVLAAAGGVHMARHGARAITSVCGTVDMAEALGVDVECDVALVAKSIADCGIGLFNGMSPQVHPMALGRILTSIAFGSTLNIAASLANPALPKRAVRGVFSAEMVRPVAEVMKAVGYERAVVLYGSIDGSQQGMDEASVCGETTGIELTESGEFVELSFRPEDFGFRTHAPTKLVPQAEKAAEARSFVDLMKGDKQGGRTEAAVVNAGVINYVANKDATIADGIARAERTLEDGEAYKTLERWVGAQNLDPDRGLETLRALG